MSRKNWQILLLVLCAAALLLGAGRQEATAHQSYVRALLLQQDAAGRCRVGLLFQNAEPSADAGDAGETLLLCTGEGESLRRAVRKAEAALPRAANYKLCDAVVLCKTADLAFLREYTAWLIDGANAGRLAARVFFCAGDVELLSGNAETGYDWAGALLDGRDTSPRLYQAMDDALLLPVVQMGETGLRADGTALLLRAGGGPVALEQAEASLLLALTGRAHTVMLDLPEERLRLSGVRVARSVQNGLPALTVSALVASDAGDAGNAGDAGSAKNAERARETLTEKTGQLLCRGGVEQLLKLPRWLAMEGLSSGSAVAVEWELYPGRYVG